MNRPRAYYRGAVRAPVRYFGAFDTETDGLGGKLLAISWALPLDDEKPQILSDATRSGVFTGRGMLEQFETLLFSTPAPQRRAKRHRPRFWLAHNLQYDLRQILPYFLDKSSTYEIHISMRSETDIFAVSLREKDSGFSVVLTDSMAVYPGSLESLTKSFAPAWAKLSGTIDFERGERFDPRDPKHLAYAERDSVGLLQAFRALDGRLRSVFGVGAKSTTASTALDAWQKTLTPGAYHSHSTPGPLEDFFRSCYYGGIVFLTSTREHCGCIGVDINSSFPAAMRRCGVPGGRHEFSRTLQNKPGYVRVTVTAPRGLVIPILGARAGDAVRWPSGTFTTTCTTPELQFALAHGYRLDEFHEGVFFESLIHPFDDFVNRCEALRGEYQAADDPAEQLVKLMQNGVYGKFGARRDRTEILVNPRPEDREGAVPLDVNERLWSRTTYSSTMATRPAWAAWITAGARLALLEAAYAVGPEHVLYSDTDSLTLDATADLSRLDIGPRYGQFKIDKRWTRFRALAPKVYAGYLIDSKGKTKAKGACKGLRKKSMTTLLWDQLLREAAIELSYPSLPSLRVALARGTTSEVARSMHRKSTDLANAKNWYVNADETVRPRQLDGSPPEA